MKHYEFIYKLFRDYKHARKGKRANIRSYLGSKIKRISVLQNEGHFCKAAGGKFQTFIFWSCMLFWDSFFLFLSLVETHLLLQLVNGNPCDQTGKHIIMIKSSYENSDQGLVAWKIVILPGEKVWIKLKGSEFLY